MAFLVLALPLLAFSSFFSSLLLFWRVNLLSLMETATFGTLLLSSGLISQVRWRSNLSIYSRLLCWC